MTIQITLTRQQRRAMERNAEGVDRATESDRKFFERFPTRNYRIRAMAPAEVAQLDIVVNGDMEPLKPGCRWFVVMRQIMPGLRFKVFRQAPAEKVGEEASEHIARSLYELHLTENPLARAREAAMMAGIKRAGTPPDQQEGGPRV